MSELKRFLIDCSVTSAEGTQTFYVDAATPEEAMALFEEGGGDMYSSEVEVTSLGKPELSGETTLDDGGTIDNFPDMQAELQASHKQAEALAGALLDYHRAAQKQGWQDNYPSKYQNADKALANYEATKVALQSAPSSGDMSGEGG